MNAHQQRTTSAGYRFSVRSRPQTSEFHQSCVPRDKGGRAPPLHTTSNLRDGDFSKCDVVKRDEIWKQSVTKERSRAKAWDENWGFMAEFDEKGRPKTPKALPDHVNMYSPNVPNTNAGNYGSRLNTDVGRAMQQMEFSFNSERRKKKLGSDLVCF